MLKTCVPLLFSLLLNNKSQIWDLCIKLLYIYLQIDSFQLCKLQLGPKDCTHKSFQLRSQWHCKLQQLRFENWKSKPQNLELFLQIGFTMKLIKVPNKMIWASNEPIVLFNYEMSSFGLNNCFQVKMYIKPIRLRQILSKFDMKNFVHCMIDFTNTCYCSSHIDKRVFNFFKKYVWRFLEY